MHNLTDSGTDRTDGAVYYKGVEWGTVRRPPNLEY